MKISILFIAVILSTSCLCYAQKAADYKFKNVVVIDDRNVVAGYDYLFDVAISDTVKEPVIFIRAEIPSALLFTMYPQFKKITVITPNWEYYRGLTKKLPPGVVCAEPRASSIIYHIDRKNGVLKKDSIVLMGGYPQMDYAKEYQPKSSEIKAYYTGSYDSTRRTIDSNIPTSANFIAGFEKENGVKISDTYEESTEKEGEITYYYTLNGLSNKLKLQFIEERRYSLIVNRATKYVVFAPKIFTPFIVTLNERMKKL